jgi:hypothetical protein
MYVLKNGSNVYNFACDSVWVWILVPDIKGGPQTESAEENLYYSQSITAIIKWSRMWWAAHVAWMRSKKNANTILVRKPFWEILSLKIGSSYIDWAQLRRFYLEAESSIQNTVLLIINRMVNNVRCDSGSEQL